MGKSEEDYQKRLQKRITRIDNAPICPEPGCASIVACRGFCNKHYSKHKRKVEWGSETWEGLKELLSP